MDEADDVFRALADPSRREILDRLFEQNGQTLGELCDGLEMSRQAFPAQWDPKLGIHVT